MQHSSRHPHGFSLIELLVAMAISLVIVMAAVYMYLASSQAQRVQDRTTTSTETGVFAMQLLGRAIMNAGFYPATVAPIPADVAQTGMYDTYPPLPSNPRVGTDWARPADGWPPTPYQTGVYGCEGSKLDPATSTCGTTSATAPDTLVVNYFTSDALGSATGLRTDCTGTDAASDAASNANRNKTAVGAVITSGPPRLPLFVSNKYSLNAVNVYVGQSAVSTMSLACSGNGNSPHGGPSAGYQPLLAGIEDLQFTYGVFSTATSLSPERFYTAAEVNGLPLLTINGQTYSGWQRVAAIQVCILTKTLNGSTRLADSASAGKTYTDCKGVSSAQPAGEIYTRLTQTFGARNNLKQSY